MPYFADFYFYKNTPMDPNEVNFFNTGGTNKDMADELLRRLKEYQVGVEYNSKVPFNPTATEIYLNAFPGVSIEINEILAIDYMIVKAYDLHNRVTQEYKYFAYFVESIEPYMQTFPTDGLEDTGVKAAFGYSYRVKLKKDTFVTDFIFSTEKISLSDIFTDGLRVNVATPILPFFDAKRALILGSSYYSGTPCITEGIRNRNISSVLPRKKFEGFTEDIGFSFQYPLIGGEFQSVKYCAIAVYSASVSDAVDYANTFVCCHLPTSNLTTSGRTLAEALEDALLLMRASRIKPKGTPGENEYIEAKYIYVLPYDFLRDTWAADPSTGTNFELFAMVGSSSTSIMTEVYKLNNNQTNDFKVFSFDLPYVNRKYYGVESCNISIVAGRQRIELPQKVYDGYFLDGGDTSCGVYFSNNDYGISVRLKVAGKVIDVTEEYALPILTASSADAVQREIAKTSSILKGALSIVGGAIATVGGFATGNAAAGVAGLGAIVGGATSFAQGAASDDRGGNVSVTGGNADAISALKNGFIYYNVEFAENSVDVLNTTQRYGYNFNGMYLKSDSESVFWVDAQKYNFLYIEANAERISDPTGYIPETFKTWLLERMKNGIRFFYTFDGFFNKSRNQTGYINA